MYNIFSNNLPKYYPFGFNNPYNAYQTNQFRSLNRALSPVETESHQSKSLSDCMHIDCSQLCKECDKFTPNKASTPLQQKPVKSCQSSPSYLSKIEESIRNSSKPISSYETDIIEINGIRGIWLNKSEVENWKGKQKFSGFKFSSY
jgi:hypothetical protein